MARRYAAPRGQRAKTIKNHRWYDGLRRAGHAPRDAARIANWMVGRGYGRGGSRTRGKRR